MQIVMCDQAFKFYKEELCLSKGDCVRFFVRYGGLNSFIKGFSLGIDKDHPEKTATSIEKDGITFFIEEGDTWYFDEKDLLVAYNEKLGEPEFKQVH